MAWVAGPPLHALQLMILWGGFAGLYKNPPRLQLDTLVSTFPKQRRTGFELSWGCRVIGAQTLRSEQGAKPNNTRHRRSRSRQIETTHHSSRHSPPARREPAGAGMAAEAGDADLRRLPPGLDRISALPDELIQAILAWLPSTAAAARTSAVSRRWRHVWTGVPALSFHVERKSTADAGDAALDAYSRSAALANRAGTSDSYPALCPVYHSADPRPDIALS